MINEMKERVQAARRLVAELQIQRSANRIQMVRGSRGTPCTIAPRDRSHTLYRRNGSVKRELVFDPATGRYQ